MFYLFLLLLLVVVYFDNTAPQFTLFHNHHHQVLFFLFVSLPCGLLIKKVYKFAFSSDNTHDPSQKNILNDVKSRHRMNDMVLESIAAEIVTF